MKIVYYSLGCPKNSADFEDILGKIAGSVTFVDAPREADVAIVNTCAFIDAAKEESIDIILELAETKKDNPALRLIVSGCMPQRYKEKLLEEIPEIDYIAPDIDSITSGDKIADYLSLPKENSKKRLTPVHYAYLKIAQGCNNRCSYCAIPLIKGNYKSRMPQEIIGAAQAFIANGAKELILVAQDTTLYGKDLKNYNIVDLLEQLNQLPEIEWIRLLYTHPNHWQDSLIQRIADLDKVVKAVDIPIQHIANNMLTAMNRHCSRKEIELLLENIRKNIKDVSIRTSLITGFPNESEQDFKELLQFVADFEFDRLGVFTYSHEEGTQAYKLQDNIPQQTKIDRQQEIMELQADISHAKNVGMIGRNCMVIIDEEATPTTPALARTQWDAPEIDNSVHVSTKAPAGSLVNVKISAADIYDLKAEMVI